MQFDGRPGVCGDGQDLVGFGRALFAQDFQSFGRWEDRRCVPGPIRVTLYVAAHAVRRIRTQVGGAWSAADAGVTDLGVVPSREASAYFFSLVPTLERANHKDRLLLPAVLADDADVTEPLLTLARDGNRVLDTRRSAVMWLGQLGDARVIPPLVEFARQDVDDEGNDKSGKKSLGGSAVMALSMLDGDIGVPPLIDLAKNAPQAGTRRNAVFWLGQNGDPRGMALIRSVIDDSNENQRVREHAIFALSQDDRSEDAGRFLVAHVRDPNQPMWLRSKALFWLAQKDDPQVRKLIADIVLK